MAVTGVINQPITNVPNPNAADGAVPQGIMTEGNYGGGTPTFTPITGSGIAVDLSNNRIWWFFNGQWN